MPRIAAVPPPLSLDVIAESFPESWRKGQRYFGEGRVRLTVTGPIEAEARVSGTRSRPYATTVRWGRKSGGWALFGKCSCPMGFDCKHAVATALAWLERQDRGEGELPAVAAGPAIRIIPPAPSPPAKPEPPPDPLALVARANPWNALAADPDARLRPTGAPDGNAAAAPEQSLRFLVDIDPRTGELGVCVGWFRRLKAGGWGKPRVLAIGPYANLGSLGGLDREDLLLVVLMLDPSHQRHGEGLIWTRPRRIDRDFVEALLGTDRCHWRAASAPVLSLGPPLPLEVE